MGQAWNAAHPEEVKAAGRAWRATNHDLVIERRRTRRAANPEKLCLQGRAWRDANRDKAREQDRRRYAADPERFLVRSRIAGHRRREAEVDCGPWTRVEATDCQVCGKAIDPTLRFPHPLSESIGHEPPLAWLRLNPDHAGPRVVRPEHLTCNKRKFTSPDWAKSPPCTGVIS